MNDFTIKYLQQKLKAATDDVASFTMMLQEQRKLVKELEAITKNNRFLTLISDKEEHEKDL